MLSPQAIFKNQQNIKSSMEEKYGDDNGGDNMLTNHFFSVVLFCKISRISLKKCPYQKKFNLRINHLEERGMM